MIGEPYEQMLRDADPYRAVAARDLDEAAEELLAQIVSEPTGRKAPYRLAAMGAAAAAVLVAAVAVPATWNGTPEPPTASVAPSVSPSATAAPSAGPSPRAVLLEPAKVQKAAQQGPRLVLGRPGWQIIHLEPYGDRMGEMAYQKGERSLMLMWYPAEEYDSYRLDRRSNKEKLTVGGLTGYLVPFGKNDFDLMTEPRDGVFAEFRTGREENWTRADFRELLAGVRQVDAATWIASVSPQITRSGENGDRAARLLMDVPRPPKWNPSALDDVTTGDHLQFDTAVAKQVTCDWLKAWQQAKATGNATGLKSAGNALLSSKNWKLLKDLEEQGSGLRQSIMTMAERVVNGNAGDAEIRAYRTNLC
jgi:hypothetical protein